MTTKKKTISVAFSGSGFLAPIHVGAACAFLDHDYTFDSVAGTSGGSIVAGIVASGFSSLQLENIAMTADFKSVLKPSIFSMIKGEAYCNGNALLELLTKLTQGRKFKDLNIPCKIIATNLNESKPYVFSKETTPDIPVALGCRASSSVPYIYASVPMEGKTLVDGGVVNNIPISFLTGPKKVGIAVNDSGVNKLGGPIKMASALISCLLSSNEGTQEVLAKSQGAGLITVDPGDIWFMDTNITMDQRKTLFKQGYQGVVSWLATQS